MTCIDYHFRTTGNLKLNLKPLLKPKIKLFGLSNFNHLNCVAGAAMLRSDNGGLELFDSRSGANIAVTDVLTAAADTPIYFETPTSIAGKDYVDVSASGHSPLGLALPRMRRLRAGDRAGSVLSLSAPSSADTGNQVQISAVIKILVGLVEVSWVSL